MNPSTIQVSARTVEQALRQDILDCGTLKALLEQELQLLNDRNSRELQPLINQKQDLMTRLEQSAGQRSQWTRFLVERTGQSTEECWQALLDQLDNPDLHQLWQELNTALRDCQTANEVNGKIIKRGQSTLRQLLSILRGQCVDTPHLYTSSGDTRGQNPSHTVIKV